jgi:two-component system, NarL family, sensor kinase
MAATGVALGAGALLLYALRGSHPIPDSVEGSLQLAAIGFTAIVAFSLFGPLIATRHPDNPIGWLFCAAGLSAGLLSFSHEYAVHALITDPGSLPGGEAMAWLTSWTWIPVVPVTGTVMLLLFPDGRVVSPRWRPVLWACVGLNVALFISVAFTTGELAGFPPEQNPIGFLPRSVMAVGVLIPIAVAVSLASVVVRYRSAEGEQRQQLRWVAAAALLYIAALVAEQAARALGLDLNGWLTLAATGVVIAAAGVAVLKYRIYDLSLVVNRTLVYGLLTGLVVGVYVAVVAGLGAVLDSSGLGVSLAATGVVAVVVAPLRSLLQRRVNRLMYGDRDEPYRALARLGERLGASLDPDAVLPTIVEAVAEGLNLPYAAIELDEDGGRRIAAEHGAARGGDLVRLELDYRGEAVGRLVVAPRNASEPLSTEDQRLLADLARQAGVAAHAVRLRQDLVHSRERLVIAREEERRRLRRDLHDGLGPTLAGIALQLESARALADRDPAAADSMLEQLTDQVQEAIGDIRRIAYDLRPPTLDELGLVAALREQAARLGGGNGSGTGPAVSVEVSGVLPQLPAAVEVAVYRIALEAMTNVSHHAEAEHCRVLLAMDGDLELEVRDDGRGLAASSKAGVGLASMRERAEELGGVLTVVPGEDRGTVVAASLPVGQG